MSSSLELIESVCILLPRTKVGTSTRYCPVVRKLPYKKRDGSKDPVAIEKTNHLG